MGGSLPETDLTAFRQAFNALQGNDPFPWQERLFREFVAGRIPSALDLPTGLGKTSVMAIWLIARALAGDHARRKLPRRLVYVVDRRAVVDQATAEAEKIRDGLPRSGMDLERLRVRNSKLAISTLRGQYVDNRDWLADPAASAIIVGTVDMIGSRLLFSGYGVSSKMRPFHAGFLGMDTLIVLDEAHLVPPFEALLRTIERDRPTFGPRSKEDRCLLPPFHLLSLSATGRDVLDDQNKADIFRLEDDDRNHPVVAKRLGAAKSLTIHDALDGRSSLVSELVERAWALGAGTKPARVLVYCHSRNDALKVEAEIRKRAKKIDLAIELLVGQRRVHERDKLSDWLDAHGFSSGTNGAPERPTFLVATAAGEVGIDLDADHMICDLVEWERMVQRLGRVNRRGSKQSQVEVVALPSKGDSKGDESWESRRERLSAPFECLPSNGSARDASPGAIAALKVDAGALDKMRKAQSEEPLRPALTRALVDAWSMTSLEEHAGRPDVQHWLRGWDEDDEPQSAIVWREHLPVRMRGDGVVQVDQIEINRFFEAAPPHLSETLEAETRRIADWLFERAAAAMIEIAKCEKADEAGPISKDSPALFILNAKDELDVDGGRSAQWTIAELVGLDVKERERDRKAFIDRLGGRTLVVAKQLAGLAEGMLKDEIDDQPPTMDSDIEWSSRPFRVCNTSDLKPTSDRAWKCTLRFVCRVGEDEEPTHWLVVDENRQDARSEESRALSSRPQLLSEHEEMTRAIVLEVAEAISLPTDYVDMLMLAAKLHDEGKDVWRWQRAFKAPHGAAYAKTKGPVNLKLLDGYRHEFGSLAKIEGSSEFRSLARDQQELLLHLVAAHHGNARPLISTKSCEGALADLEDRALKTTLRFQWLQRRWGPWGLAWWEALLRAADQGASRENDDREEAESGGAEGRAA